MSISKKKCCVPGCMESGSHATLHSFPNPAKDKPRFNQWVLAIGGDIIGLDNEDILKRRSVCHIHFEEKFWCRYNRLSNIAVPTLNLPAIVNPDKTATAKMERNYKVADQLCLGCLCTPNENKLHDYKFQYGHFRDIFEVRTIRLCYLCKRIAQHAEMFIQNVQSNQILLQNCFGDLQSTIKDARSKLQPSITLSHAPLDPTIIPKNVEINFESTRVEYKTIESVSCNKAQISTNEENSLYSYDSEMRNEDAIVMNRKIIKVELEEQEALDHFDGGFVDENRKNQKNIKVELEIEKALNDFDKGFIDESNAFKSPYIKKDDDLKAEAMNMKALQPFKKINKIKIEGKNLKKIVSKAKEIEKIEALRIKKIFITNEQFMEERKQKALNELYLNCAYKCVDCLKGFNYKAAYDNHLRKHSKEMGEFECEICKIRMDSRKKMLKHKLCHKRRFQCTECGIVRISQSTLLDHYYVKHKKGERQYACPYCPKSFNRSRSQNKHIQFIHQNRERVTCSYCEKSYANKEVLKTHMMIQHPKEVAAIEPVKKYPCKKCGMKFRTRNNLKAHSYKHTLSRNYYCVECDKAFKSEALLKQHLKNAQAHVNNSDLPLCCDQCTKRFAIKRDVERHMNLVHLEVKPFKCDKCDKAYVSKSSLVNHKRRTHEGYKPTSRHSCRICDKTFEQSSILKAHIRTHTGERPYQCDKCPSKFRQSGALATHNKLVHQRLTRDGRPKQNAPLKTFK